MSEEKAKTQRTHFETVANAVAVVLLWAILAAVFVVMLFRPLDATWVACVGIAEAVIGPWLTETVLG